MVDFDGFPDDATKLLAELPGFTRDDYARWKAEVQAALLNAAKAYVVAMVRALREVFGPGIDGSPKVNGSISPLTNDLRFAPEGTPPYRDHLLVWFWDGPSKKTSPRLAMRLTVTDAGFGIGMGFDAEQLERWRVAVAADTTGAPLAEVIERLAHAHHATAVGQELKRVPAPFGADHRRGDLLRHKAFQVRWTEPVPSALGRPATSTGASTASSAPLRSTRSCATTSPDPSPMRRQR